jgi:RHS repeat-associated protein
VSSTSRTYAYDGDGLLQSRTQGGSTVNLLWDPAPSPSRLLQVGSDKIVYGLGPLYAVTASGTTTFARDGGKSVHAELNGSGSVTASFRYLAYGAIAQSNGSSTPSYLGYAGQLLDPSGLYYMRARWYDPNTGRLVTRDPQEGDPAQPLSLNLFGYAYSNPMLWRDPSGLAATTRNEYGGQCGIECLAEIARERELDAELGAIATGITAVGAADDTLLGARTTATAVARGVRAGQSGGVSLGRIGAYTAFGRSPLFRAAGPPIAALSIAVDTLSQIQSGADPGEAVVRAVLSGAGASAGGALGAAACGEGAFGTGGGAFVLCPVAVGGGGVLGGLVGDFLGDTIFGPRRRL